MEAAAPPPTERLEDPLTGLPAQGGLLIRAGQSRHAFAPREGGSDFPSLDGESEFPLGFPLRDGGAEEWREEVEPIASADDIAMLERMFGARE